MKVEELEVPWNELTDIAKSLQDLILPEWFNGLEITNELKGVQEAV
jgi:hypothetical protein